MYAYHSKKYDDVADNEGNKGEASEDGNGRIVAEKAKPSRLRRLDPKGDAMSNDLPFCKCADIN